MINILRQALKEELVVWRRRAISAVIVALGIAGYYVYDLYDELYGRPYQRYEPICWHGDFVTVPGELKPEFYREALPRLVAYTRNVPGGGEFVIYIKPRLSFGDKVDIAERTTDAAYAVMAAKWGLKDDGVQSHILFGRVKKEVPGFRDPDRLSCEQIRWIAIKSD